MPIDLALLASTVVSSFLVPMAKRGLEKLRENASEAAGEAVGDATASGVSKVWERVKSLFTSDRERVQFEELEQHPDDGAATVRRVLEEKLRADPTAAQELDRLVNAPVGSGGATLQHLMAGTLGFVDARGAHVSGSAQVAGVVINAAARPRADES
ncbi:hypothetical protein J421_4142 [Gemmatirosa kalamazoonensis]|uniref:Uncharacterized protein n=1 Tax=Gemmatirosa kalamazoonensis TaxID=861299 RepID=W0RKT3_9BACT|nr:hypothetical protein [Gemmatirosa kalamazoonensis]AHG91679.1 hypothetical protein J421_4142 [Gemmatirosa kalamazoonensis]